MPSWGTSGSGKSTLLNMLAGLEKPTKGEIAIGRCRLDQMNENQLVRFRREAVGFIFQSFNLIPSMNALENVALPLSFRGVPKKNPSGQGSPPAENGWDLRNICFTNLLRCPAVSSSGWG